MPVPYEPVLRHEPIPGQPAQCLECQYDTINDVCQKSDCVCSCKLLFATVENIADHRDPLPPDPDSEMAVADWGDGPLQWREPHAQPEPTSWYDTPDTDYPVDPNAEDIKVYRSVTEDKYLARKPRNVKIKEFIAKWELPWAVLTTMLYLGAVILLVTVFPDVSNTWVSVFVLVSGLTASLTALASVLKTKE